MQTEMAEGGWRRTFVFSFIAQFLVIVGVSFATPFLPFFVGELGVGDSGRQAFWAGIVMAIGGLTFAVMAPVWGALADRYGRKPMVFRAMVGASVAVFLMSFAKSIPQMILFRIFQGAFSGTLAASIALVASVTPRNHSGLALGMMQTAVSMGNAIGPLIGGLAADALGYRTSFRVGALLTMLGAVLVLFGTKEAFARPAEGRKDESLGFGKIMLLPGFMVSVLILFSVRLGNSLANPAFPLIVGDLVGSTTKLNSITGAVIGAAAIAAAVGAALLGHAGDRLGRRMILLGCCAGAACGALGHYFARHLQDLFMARVLFGFCMAGMLPAANAMIQAVVDKRAIGKAYGLATSISMLGAACGPYIGGTLAMHTGLRVPFLVTAAAQIGLVFMVIGFYKEKLERDEG